MPARVKTRYPGVYYREAQRIGSPGTEKVFYIVFKKDGKAIDRILSLDPEGLYEIVVKERISMCGYIPTTAVLFTAKALGAQSAKLVKYSTSAEVSGDYEHVVGYAGIVLR